MQTIPVQDAEEAIANQCFEALLWATSRPGQIRTLPQEGMGQIVAALLDRECAVYAREEALAEEIARTGAELVALEKADHAFVGKAENAGFLAQLQCGSDLYPDDGATLIVEATFGQGPMLRFKGPGVEGALDVQINGLPDGFWQQREKLIRYPMGFEILLVDGDRVIGVPRSTKVEIA